MTLTAVQAVSLEPLSVEDDDVWSAFLESQLYDTYDTDDFSDDLDESLAETVDDWLDVIDRAVTEVLAGVRRDADRVRPGDVVAWMHRVEAVQRRLPAVQHVLIAAVEERGIHSDYCRATPASLLIDELNLRPGEARERVRAAQVLGPRRSLTGEPLPPRYEVLARAQEQGVVSADHARVIDRAVQQLPTTCDPDPVQALEQTLSRQAGLLDPQSLFHIARRAVDLIDPDGREPVDHRAQRLRDLRLTARDTGIGGVAGELTPECLLVWQTILDTLARPLSAEDGLRDSRTPGQRNHDAFLAAGKRLLRDDGLPAGGGVPATIIVTVDADDLVGRTGHATTAHGQPWPMADMLAALGDEAEWVTVFGSATNGVIGYGTDRRFASPAQTKALIARDHGCSFPGCSVPAAWCDRHHIVPVVPKKPGDPPGRTDLDNLTLLCGFHHRMFETAGWRCRMIDGHPHWIPPAWIDRQQTPRRNTFWMVDAAP